MMIARRILSLLLAAGLIAGTFAGAARADSCSLAQMNANACTSYDGGFANLGITERQMLAYFDSGRYERDVASVDGRLDAYVTKRLHDRIKKPAVVFDIDDTSLSGYPYEKAHDFGFDEKSYEVTEATGFPAIMPTLRLAQRLHAQGVAVFFITGRRTPLRAITISNLMKVGYPTPTGLYLRPVGDRAKSVIPFKSSTRAKIAALGYTVLASVGDQWSDLRGGSAEQLFKLPNPMYFLP
jgi:hypothetical protein